MSTRVDVEHDLVSDQHSKGGRRRRVSVFSFRRVSVAVTFEVERARSRPAVGLPVVRDDSAHADRQRRMGRRDLMDTDDESKKADRHQHPRPSQPVPRMGRVRPEWMHRPGLVNRCRFDREQAATAGRVVEVARDAVGQRVKGGTADAFGDRADVSPVAGPIAGVDHSTSQRSRDEGDGAVHRVDQEAESPPRDVEAHARCDEAEHSADRAVEQQRDRRPTSSKRWPDDQPPGPGPEQATGLPRAQPAIPVGGQVVIVEAEESFEGPLVQVRVMVYGR